VRSASWAATRGWIVLATATCVLALSSGIRFSFGAVLPALVADRGWSLAAVAGIPAVASLVVGALQPFVGGLADRRGPRLVLSLGAAFIGIGLLASVAGRQVWHLYVAFGLIAGVGFGGTLQLTGSLLAVRWFPQALGFAVSFVQSAIGIASFVVVPVATWLVLRVGWTGYFVTTGMLLLVVVAPLTLLLVRDAPPDDVPGRERPAPHEATARPSPRTPLSRAIWTRAFAALAAGMFA
jgi:sugar phosphate permease